MKSNYQPLFAICLCMLAASALAEDKGWKMPNLNPFSGKTGTTSPATSGWKMPKMPSIMPKKSTAKRRSNQPSTLSKMTNGTKNFMSKTADAINPWDDKPQPAPKITGSNSIFTQQGKAAAKKESSGSILPAGWFGSDKKEEPKSVNDFLSQQRP